MIYIKELSEVKILVAEDDEILGDLAKWRLREMGFTEFQVVTSGEEAVALADIFEPDLILMDITLDGEMDGIDAVIEIRKALPSVPVIYLSSHMEPEIIERAINTIPAGYVAKPFDDFELSMAIKIALLKRD